MKKLNVIYFCLVFALLFAMCSCGARKVNKIHYKEETHSSVADNSKTESVTDTNVKTTTTTKTDDKNESVTEETIYKPEDSSKEAFIIEKDGTKTVLNNAKKIVRKTTQKNNTVTASNVVAAEVKKQAVKEQKAVKQVNVSKKETSSKEVDKKQFNPFWWFIGIGFFLVFLCLLYYVLKKLRII